MNNDLGDNNDILQFLLTLLKALIKNQLLGIFNDQDFSLK